MNFRNRGTTALFATLSLLMVVGFSDTAQGQTLTFTVNGVATASPVLNFPIESGIFSQQIQITSTSETTVTYDLAPFNSAGKSWTGATGTQQWLYANFNVTPPNTPVTLTVTVDENNTNGQPQTATFGVGVTGQQTSSYTVVTVNLVAGGGSGSTSAFSASPSSLSFAAVQGTLVASPAQTAVQILNGSGSMLDYNLIVSPPGNWLLVSSCLINPCLAGVSGPGFLVEVNPEAPNLVAGTTYQGTITVESTTTLDSVVIPVVFTFSPNTTLTVTPAAPPSFLLQVGTGVTQPSQETLEVTTSLGSEAFTDSITTMSGGSWLIPGTFSSPGTPIGIPLSVNTGAAPAQPGKYTDVLTFTPSNGAPPVPVNVSLVVTSDPLLQLSNSTLNFSAQFGSTAGSTQQLNLTSTGSAVGFAIADDSTAPWLGASSVGGLSTASSTTPATISFTVNPSGVAAGTHTGTILITPTSGDQYSLAVTVTLTIASTSQITAAPPLLHFSWETSQVAPAFENQNIQIASNQPVSFTVPVGAQPTTVTANCPANWLQVGTPSSNTTPATLTISVVTSGMTPGFCTGTIVVTPTSGSGATVLNIPVTIDVSNIALLNVNLSSGFGVQTASQGAPATNLQIPLTSTDPNNQVQFSATSSTSWLAVAYNSPAITPQNLVVTVLPSTLTPATYVATITISSTSLPSGTISIPYTLTVTPNTTVGLSASNITFTQPQGGPTPQTQNLTLTTTGGTAQYSAQVNAITGGNWLQVNSGSSTSGTITSTGTAISLSINPSVANALSANTYTSTISLLYPGTATVSAAVTVTLTVTAQGIVASPTSLSFSYQSAGTTPASQPLSVTSIGGAVNFTATASSTGNWLALDTSTASTPATINVAIIPANIPLGSAGAVLTGTVSISAPSVQSNPVTVNVTLTVLVSPSPQPVTIKNSGSLTFGAIAPGEIITIQGNNLGPTTAASFSLNSQGGVNSALAGVQVMFDLVPGTPTYVSSTVINVIVPYEIAGRTTTNVSVVYQGLASAPIPQQVVAVAPSIFTFSANGLGQAVAGNVTGPTAGTNNGPSSPVTQGSYFFIYWTGCGVTNPAAATGSVNSTTTLMPLVNWTPTSGTVSATVGGAPAKVSFAGAAPGLVAGVCQINIQAPIGVSGSAEPLVIMVDGATSPTGTTVAVQ